VKKLCVLILGILFFPGIGHAHSPYSIKASVITGPEQQKLFVERLYGDGIFFADPVAVQIRNAYGAPIGQSSAGKGAGIFCPSYKHCYAFIDQGLGIASAQKFDWENADYDLKPSKAEIETLQAYLNDPSIERLHSYEHNKYPEMSQNDFLKAPLILIALSPFMLFLAHYAQLTTLFIIFFTTLYLWTKLKSTNQENLIKQAILVLLLAPFGFFSFFSPILLWVYTGAPLLQIVVMAALSHYICKKLPQNTNKV
jgi:hypothetical protein